MTFTVPDTWWDGLSALTYVVLSDLGGNTVDYSRWAKTSITPVGATGPTGQTLVFTPGDLTVSGSTADSAIPTLTSVSVTGQARPGQTISGHFATTDASGALKSIVMNFRDSYGMTRALTAKGTGPIPLSGVIDQVIPATWPNGTYLLDDVRLADALGNTGDYYADGRVFAATADAHGPASHTVDFGLATFTVSGSTADFTPPRLTGLKLTGSPMLTGQSATLSYTVESLDPLSYVSFKYAERANPLGNQRVFGGPKTQLDGTQAVSFAVDSPWGAYDLKEIYLRDSAGNSISYLPDGTTSQGPGGLAGTHPFAMNSSTVLVGGPSARPRMQGVRTRSTSALVLWDPPENEWTVSGYTITVQPGGRTFTTAGMSVPSVPTRWTEITGLTNNVTYTFTVTATNAFGKSPASLASSATPRMSTAIIAGKDFTGDGRSDLIGLRSSTAPFDYGRIPYLYRGNGVGGFASSGRKTSDLWGDDPTVFSSGDFSADGKNDIMGVDPAGHLMLFNGNGLGAFYPGHSGQPLGVGWGRFTSLFSPGDFTGDGKNDIMGVSRDAGLYLYRGNGLGGFTGAGLRVGYGWAGFLTVFSPGDFSGDGKNDILAVSRDGGLYLYRGNGRGGFTGAGQRIGNGWGGFLGVFSPGDFTGDHRSDVMAFNTAGDLVLYRGSGRGGFAAGGQTIGSGWSMYR